MQRLPSGRQSIDASSMADIAFLLLVFFLVTTTMAQEIGIPRKLPPPNDNPIPITQPRHNVLEILANANDELLVEQELSSTEALKQAVLDQLYNRENHLYWPDKRQINETTCLERLVAIEAQLADDPEPARLMSSRNKWQRRLDATRLLGPYEESKLIISMQNDRSTSYDFYIAIQDQLAAAYNEARNALAEERLGKTYDQLSVAEKLAIRTAIPQRISEAEPKTTN